MKTCSKSVAYGWLLIVVITMSFMGNSVYAQETKPVKNQRSSDTTSAKELAPPSPSLSDSQITRLKTAKDNSGTIDEAAFYALLENLSDWTYDTAVYDPNKPPGVVPPRAEDRLDPNFSLIRENTEKYRGRIFTIVGKLIMSRKVENLSREGWEDVTALTIQVGDLSKPLKSLTNDDMVIVYLTHPPELTRAVLDLTGQPAEAGSTVKIYTRFYKSIQIKNRNGEPKPYLAFVGRSIEGNIQVESNKFVYMIVGLVLFLLAAFIWLQVYTRRKAAERVIERQNRARERIQERADEPDLNLPKDPIEALSMLETLEVDDENEKLGEMHRDDDPTTSLDELTQQANKKEDE